MKKTDNKKKTTKRTKKKRNVIIMDPEGLAQRYADALDRFAATQGYQIDWSE
ncbi:hypothetical protein [Clostridium baratii]|uniref:hypothetical protein n=1 Tax=Clostridium baratii TaxID=1561 RepID=UPI0030CB0479